MKKRVQAVLTGTAFFAALIFCSEMANPAIPSEVTRPGFAICGKIYIDGINKPYHIKDKDLTGKINVIFSTNGTSIIDDDEIIYIRKEV